MTAAEIYYNIDSVSKGALAEALNLTQEETKNSKKEELAEYFMEEYRNNVLYSDEEEDQDVEEMAKILEALDRVGRERGEEGYAGKEELRKLLGLPMQEAKGMSREEIVSLAASIAGEHAKEHAKKLEMNGLDAMNETLKWEEELKKDGSKQPIDKYVRGIGIYVGRFGLDAIQRGDDKKALSSIQKRTGLKYSNTKPLKSQGEITAIVIWTCDIGDFDAKNPM